MTDIIENNLTIEEAMQALQSSYRSEIEFLRKDNSALRLIVSGLSERVARQSELLSKRAEK